MPDSILQQARVLIVDDDPSNVRLLERILEVHEVGQVRTTTDSRAAFPLFVDFKPDIVLLDLNMPYLDGFGVMAQLQAVIAPEDCVPIVILTADITAETKRRALRSGAKDFLTKPLDNTEVLLRIRNLLENRFLHLDMQLRVKERTAQLEKAVAELKSTQEAVIKQERLLALGTMAGGIAHDFNNALTMMLGYGELLLPWCEKHAGPRELTYLKHIINSAHDATHVVSRLREFYRPAENNEVRTPVNLSEVARAAMDLTEPKWKGKARSHGVEVKMRLELSDVPPVAGNAAELREVLTNLIFNAVDAMPEGGSITLRTRHDDSGVAIAVMDTGAGMTEAERGRCLEPFFTTKGEGGTGLGLAVVYGIIQRHGGFIDITSEKGVGSTFEIRLPETTMEAAVSLPVEPCAARPLRILVVDDQDVICELIAEYLQAEGHQTATAFNGREALEVFSRDHYDLVITDQSMPGMSGEQLAGYVKKQAPSAAVILLTGFGEEMMESEGRCVAVDVILGKPASAADLRAAVSKALGRAEVRSAA